MKNKKLTDSNISGAVFEPAENKGLEERWGLKKELLPIIVTAAHDIMKEGYDQQFGARPLRRFIQDNIEDLIAQKMLKDEIKRGDKVFLSVDTSNNLQLAING